MQKKIFRSCKKNEVKKKNGKKNKIVKKNKK
jgi:hypothetical protein